MNTVNDFYWGMNIIVHLPKRDVKVHTLTRFSSVPSLDFVGYMLVRTCGSNEVYQVPLTTPAEECECSCPVFVYGDID